MLVVFGVIVIHILNILKHPIGCAKLKHIAALRSIVKGVVKENEPMSKHTYYGIGGPAHAYITPKNKVDLRKILGYANENSIPIYFIGSGSNLLVSDDGIKGFVLNPGKALRNLEFKNESVFAESGVMLGKLVRESIKRNLSGLETLIGVPGTLGGALIMNAGAFGGEISHYLQKVEIMAMNGKIYSYTPNEIDFAYRFSSFKESEFILSANFLLHKEDPSIIQKKKNAANKGRKKNQPLKYRSAGSIFKNPDDVAAGYLIDQAGLKGTRIGDAEISTKHANFIINLGNAKSSDVIELIKIIKNKIYTLYNIKLELEIKIIGELINEIYE